MYELRLIDPDGYTAADVVTVPHDQTAATEHRLKTVDAPAHAARWPGYRTADYRVQTTPID